MQYIESIFKSIDNIICTFCTFFLTIHKIIKSLSYCGSQAVTGNLLLRVFLLNRLRRAARQPSLVPFSETDNTFRPIQSKTDLLFRKKYYNFNKSAFSQGQINKSFGFTINSKRCRFGQDQGRCVNFYESCDNNDNVTNVYFIPHFA